jgi:ATP-binding cassette, subfamily C, bacterial exporter for protease/lipase
MYDDPSFIVLDEPNSNLDEVGEQALIAAVQDLRARGKTIVMITHRASTLAVTNKLLVLKDGVAQMFGMTLEVLENLSKLNQQQIKQTQEPAAGAANGKVEDASKKAESSANKDAAKVENIVESFKMSMQESVKSKLKDTQNETK